MTLRDGVVFTSKSLCHSSRSYGSLKAAVSLQAAKRILATMPLLPLCRGDTRNRVEMTSLSPK